MKKSAASIPPVVNNTALLVLSLFLLSLLVFWPGVSGGFLFDDYHNIVTNAHVQITEISAESLWRAVSAYKTRPLPMLTFALNAYWAGLEPWAYKVTGLLVHAVNAVLIGLLSLRFLTFTPQISLHQRSWAAFSLALVWALHPLQVSSALYIVQRMETLCFTFIFITILLYMQARSQQIAQGRSRNLLWLGIAVSATLALLCKESALLLPLFFLALELTVLRFKSASHSQTRMLHRLYVLAMLLALLVFFTLALPHYYSTELHSGRDFNTAQRLLTQFRVLVLYLQQIVLPLPSSIHFYYDDLQVSKGWLNPLSTILSALLLIGILCIALYWRRRYPLAALGVLIFFSSHFITSNAIPLEMVFEHRNYFALYGILLTCADFISRIPMRDGPNIKYVAVGVLVSGFVFLGGIRAALWSNELLLATDMAINNPASGRAGVELGNAYYALSAGDEESPMYYLAATQYKQTATLESASIQPNINIIIMNANAELPVDKFNMSEIWERLLFQLKNAHMSIENKTSIWPVLAQRMQGKRVDDRYLSQALEIIFSRTEQDDYRHAQTADYYLKLQNDNEAITHYRIAIQKAKINGNNQLIDTINEQLLESDRLDLMLQL